MVASTCGFADGNLALPRVAAPGWDCTVDTVHGIWGFCPTDVKAVTDCGLAGYCFDSSGCKNGCGPLPDVSTIKTTTCSGTAPYCHFLLSINGNSPASTYPWIACSDRSITDTIYAIPTVDATKTPSPSTTTLSPSSAISRTPASSTPFETAKDATAATTSASLPSAAPASGTPVGAIVGGTIGGVAFVFLMALAAILLRRRHNRNKVSLHIQELHKPYGGAAPGDASKNHPGVPNQALFEVSELNNDPAELYGEHQVREL